ncbi:hypothetical protein ABG067_000036 [Albugo candida]
MIHRKKKLLGKKSDDEYPLTNEDEIFNGRYRVQGKQMGLGSFGQVVEGTDLETNEKVAIKIIKKKRNFLAQAQTEISVLEVLHRHHHPGRKMIVHLKCSFLHKGFQCLVFELLSYNLYELIQSTGFRGIGLSLLRKVAGQILQALDYMAQPSVKVIHCDLKPENILLVDPKHSQIKIIDFGSSCFSHEQLYHYIQSRYYRAPEVLLGMKYTYAIDMWSLGCILVEMHTGKPLFKGADQHDQLRRITLVLGMFPQHFIEQTPSMYRREYFDEARVVEGDKVIHQYRLKDCKSYGSGQKEQPFARSLAEILGVDIGGPEGRRRGEKHHSRNQYLCFLDLIRRMLEYDPVARISPSEALKHPFFDTEVEVNKKSKCMRSTASRVTYNDDYESSWEPEIEDFEMLERSWSNATPSLAELVREDIPSARQFFRKVLQAKYPKELGMWNKWAVMEWKSANYDLARVIFKKASKIRYDLRLWVSWATMEMECNNYHESKRLFHVIIATDPKNSHALLGLALLEMKQGYNHKAKKIFNELIREYPKDVNAFQAYGIFQGKCKNMKEARELFHHATQLDDVGGQVWHAWAKAEYEMGFYRRALSVLEQGMMQFPTHKYLILLSAMAQFKAGDQWEGRRTFSQLVDSGDFIHAAFFNAFAKMEEEAGDMTQAESLYRDALNLHPDHVPSIMSFAILQAQGGNVQAGRELFEQSIPIVKEVGTLLFAWGSFEEQYGELTHAKQIFEETTAKEPTHLEAWRALARVENKLGNVQNARAVLTRAAQHVDNSVPLLMQLAKNEERNNNIDEARRTLEKALELDNENGSVWNFRALLELRHDPTKTLSLVESALECIPAHETHTQSILYCTYGRALAMTQEYEAAVTAFKKSLQLVPRNPETHIVYVDCVLIPTERWIDAEKHLHFAKMCIHRNAKQRQKIEKKLAIVQRRL